MTVISAWLRLELRRRRWRSLAVLGLLVAISSGTVLVAGAGARRQASARERLDERTLPAHAAILANTPDFDWDRIAALPEVEALATFGPSFAIEGLPPDAEANVVIGGQIMRTIERPVVLEGRMLDIARTGEAVMSRAFAARFHKRVGDRLAIVLPTPDELQAQGGSGPNGAMTGPRLSVRIVGIVVSPWFRDEPGLPPSLTLSPAVASRYALNVVGDQHDPKNQNAVNAMVRLRGGESAITVLRKDVGRVSGRPDVEVWNLAEQFGRPLQRQATFEARCLMAFGVAALLAALFLVGQAIARYAAATTAELSTVRALGMTPRQTVAAATAGPLLAGVLGAGLGVVGAFLASRWFPFGVALIVEPDPGRSADWVVFGPGFFAVVLLVSIGAAVAASLALRAAGREQPRRRSGVATLVARGGLPVPVVIGSRFALEGGRGRGSVPVRPALIGSIGGVLGIIAAFTFSHGVTDASKHPERFGQTFQAYAWVGTSGQDYAPVDRLTEALVAEPDVVGIDDARVSVATGAGGRASVSLYSYSGGSKPLDAVVTSGHMPSAANEVLLGRESLAALHAQVGDSVGLTTTKGTRKFVVTGSGMVPNGAHNNYADGGWLTDAGYDALFDGHKFHLVYIALRPGARTPDALTALTAAVTRSNHDLAAVQFVPPDPLTELVELRQVRMIPILLGLFLAVLAVGAVGHALATAVRRRAHDLAVLRALGMTQWQCRWIVVNHATVLAVVGLVFGVPLGLALGLSVWRAVADSTPIQYVPPLAVWALVVIGPAALLVANALAAWQGHRAARLRVASILRTE